MMQRRDIVARGLMTGFAALVAPEAVEAAPADDEIEVARAIGTLRTTIEEHAKSFDPGSLPAVEHIRQQQRVFLKANQKFPDVLEVGIDVWEQVHDWHVRHQHPVNMVRLGDGRYGMTFMFTMLVLRPDQTGTYIGWGYDVR